MKEDELDSLGLRPWGTKDAMKTEAQLLHRARLAATLGVALWGKTPEDLKRQLLAPHPEIPSGFDLADFRELALSAQMVANVLEHARKFGLHPAIYTPAIFIGAEGFTLWEARCEIVRRAIEFLENR